MIDQNHGGIRPRGRYPRWIWLILFYLLSAVPLWAGDLETIGLTRLLGSQPGLTGAGVIVAQPESGNNSPAFEINPLAVAEPEDLFSWISTNGNASVFPNNVGTESGHADGVADNFFAPGTGVATGVSHVDNYDADYFVNAVIDTDQSISDQVVNQSFIDTALTNVASDDSFYDDYVATHGTIICSAVGNGGHVYPPATAYNVISVGCYGIGASSSSGPTTDNGRSKPDLIAPSQETSFSTPYVSGSAAVLLQAASRGDGGTNLAGAGDVRTIKALLMNGAIKPFGWSRSATAPLDKLYGAGLLNVDYSYDQLAAGQRPFSASDTSSAPEYSNPIATPQGWDFRPITSNPASPTVNHYCFEVSNARGFTLTATLVWERALGASGVNQLTLALDDFDTGALVAQSVSTVDNVQHLYVPRLDSGKYDLQVRRVAALSPVADDYALAYQFFPISPPTLSIVAVGKSVTISWPATPTIYTLQQTASLNPPISWNAVSASHLLTNGLVVVNLTAATTSFYRLLQ